MKSNSSKANDPVNAWFKAQRAFWQGWVNLASIPLFQIPNVDRTEEESKTSNGLVSDITIQEMNSQWQKLWWHNIETWTSSTAPIARASVEQFNAVQQATLRFVDFSARAWQALSPDKSSSEELDATLQNAGREIIEEFTNLPEDFIAAAGDLSRLWETYISQWQSFGQPWLSAVQASPEFITQVASGESNGVIELSKLYRNAYNETFRQLITSPNLGPTRELSEKILRGFDAWVDWQMAMFEYQTIMMEIWQEAIDDYMKTLVDLAEQDEKIDSVRGLILLWTRGAEKIFTHAFRTERYVLAQGRMLNAAMEQRSRQREILEIFLQALDLPTRTELDETHHRIYELRKEVKTLKKELASLRKQESNKSMQGKTRPRKPKSDSKPVDNSDDARGDK
jgi:class III poly(R)-hydroxyalkanoic acid synthase PhaE subunit